MILTAKEIDLFVEILSHFQIYPKRYIFDGIGYFVLGDAISKKIANNIPFGDIFFGTKFETEENLTKNPKFSTFIYQKTPKKAKKDGKIEYFWDIGELSGKVGIVFYFKASYPFPTHCEIYSEDGKRRYEIR